MQNVWLALTSRHQQRSASATSTSEQSFSDEHQKRRVASAHFDRLKKRRRDDVTTTIRVSPPPPLSLTRQSYFDKMMTCVRRTLVNRVNRSQYRTQWCVDSPKEKFRNCLIYWGKNSWSMKWFYMFDKKKRNMVHSVERLCNLAREKIMCKKS